MESLISFETIRSIHRAEKDEQLSKLPPGFFTGVQQWLQHKRSRGDANSILESESAKKLLEDIINRRQRKIILAALSSARGSAPPQNMTLEESDFFDRMLSIVKAQQNESKERMFGAGFVIEQKMEEARKSLEEIKAPQQQNIERKTEPVLPEQHIATQPTQPEQPSAAHPTPQAQKPLNSIKKVKILAEVSRFVDMHGAQYGPFKTGETVDVPEEIFRLLSMRQRAEEA